MRRKCFISAAILSAVCGWGNCAQAAERAAFLISDGLAAEGIQVGLEDDIFQKEEIIQKDDGCQKGTSLQKKTSYQKDTSCQKETACDPGKGGKGAAQKEWFGGANCLSVCDDPTAFEICPADNFLGVKIGGWTQVGYTSESTGLFNSDPGKLNLHQQWLYGEKVADGSCGLDWGFRVDAMYGTDGADTQAFGNNPGNWDFLNGYDHGIYSWALPQAYAELAYGDMSVIVGHFYTLVGYEVVTAPDNFFFSHAFTMYNSEPFTHTGMLGTYRRQRQSGHLRRLDSGLGYRIRPLRRRQQLSGWLQRHDDGRRHVDLHLHRGRPWLAGGRLQPQCGRGLCADRTLELCLAERPGHTNGVADPRYPVRKRPMTTSGINQYLFYSLNDCWGFGARVEWWKQDGVSTNAITLGVNWMPHTNLRFRPEIRQQWVPTDDYEATIFGIDAIVTY